MMSVHAAEVGLGFIQASRGRVNNARVEHNRKTHNPPSEAGKYVAHDRKISECTGARHA